MVTCLGRWHVSGPAGGPEPHVRGLVLCVLGAPERFGAERNVKQSLSADTELDQSQKSRKDSDAIVQASEDRGPDGGARGGRTSVRLME